MKRLILLPAMCLCLSGCAVFDVLDCVDPFGSCESLHKRLDKNYKPTYGTKKRRASVDYEAYKHHDYNKDTPLKKPPKTWGDKE
ncbi:MAG: hypothetical protein IPH06_05335 [Alphaproteobacteria bacterium]|nr:hypothetical protein [Alphaproteobacteria bacterium]QQS57445.1 MAG: hypothetical protein IPN28_01100 [Alphaproteobacteria bacterium]